MEKIELLNYIDSILERDQNGHICINELDIEDLTHYEYIDLLRNLDNLKIPSYNSEKSTVVDLDKLTEFLYYEFIPENIRTITDKNISVISLKSINELKLSKEEFKYAIDFIHSLGIKVPKSDEYLKRYQTENYYVSEYYNSLPTAATKEVNFELFDKYKKCNDENERKKIRDEIICKNIKLANYTAICCLSRFDVNVEDYFSYAQEELIRCVEKYDQNLGFSFSTYAYKCIYYKMFRAYCDSMNLPYHLAEKFVIAQTLVQKAFGKKYIRGDKEMLDDILLILSKFGVSNKNIELLKYSQLVNIDSDNYFEDDYSLDDLLEYDFEKKAVRILTDDLSDKDVDILNHTYGLNDTPHISNEKIGKKYGVSRNSIWERKQRIILFLRAKARKNAFFIEENNPYYRGRRR